MFIGFLFLFSGQCVIFKNLKTSFPYKYRMNTCQQFSQFINEGTNKIGKLVPRAYKVQLFLYIKQKIVKRRLLGYIQNWLMLYRERKH